ncbi:TetR/AcrR family transcriptional regulator [Bartonella sp. DGB2]|uniref:TetR/AcrR family transcriptional regulator n=1 Tax=Bartonella sp. DGB2 TaxID=3388426 RepID=UPI0039900674
MGVELAELTVRQKEVLEGALGLLVAADEALTTENIARAARCSKETLYKWFGDRDGLLEAMVRWQASKVRITPLKRQALNADSLFFCLKHFAYDWLLVLSSPTSIALNRLAVSHARSNQSRLGEIVLQNGPFAMAKRLIPVLELGREAGLLAFEKSEETFRCFFGLVVGDMQICKLLGAVFSLDETQIGARAHLATQQFFALYGVKI